MRGISPSAVTWLYSARAMLLGRRKAAAMMEAKRGEGHRSALAASVDGDVMSDEIIETGPAGGSPDVLGVFAGVDDHLVVDLADEVEYPHASPVIDVADVTASGAAPTKSADTRRILRGAAADWSCRW